MKKIFLSVVALSFAASCTSPGKKTAIGAGAGAAAGALAGAVIGHQSGNGGKGALIGAAAGALIGGSVGNYLDKQAKELAQVAETKRTEHGIVTKLKGDILFDSGSATLKPAAVDNINKLADIIKKYPEDRITIVGHTDNVGKPEQNQTLSEQRAKAVMLQITNRGVAPASVSVVGMGQSQPVTDNKTPASRSQNRRVELQITVPEENQEG